MKQTITELAALKGRVYVHLASAELGRRFLAQAEAEGFAFADGVRPTWREAAQIMAVNADHTLSYVGTVGAIAFGSGAGTVGGTPLLRAYYTGEDFTFTRPDSV